MPTSLSDDASRSLDQALQELFHAPVPILAGGTDFYPALRDAPAPEKVLDVTRIAGLRGIERQDGGWRIGAATTWSDIIRTPLPPVFDGLKVAASEVGSLQIQNAGTLAGNLCNASPAADGVPALLTLNASVELASMSARRILPLQDFISGVRQTALKPDELMIAIHVPDSSEAARSVFAKLGARRFLVISIVMASMTLEADEHGCLQEVRIAVGACSAVAMRMPQLEQALLGRSVQEDLVSLITPALLTGLRPIDDVRGSAAYRLLAVQQVLGRMLKACVQALPVKAGSDAPSLRLGADSDDD